MAELWTRQQLARYLADRGIATTPDSVRAWCSRHRVQRMVVYDADTVRAAIALMKHPGTPKRPRPHPGERHS